MNAKIMRETKIVAAEYSINDIGTAGKGIPITITSGLNSIINIKDLNLKLGDMDRIYLRVKNELGVWSNPYCFHYSDFFGIKARNQNIDYSESIRSIKPPIKNGTEIPVNTPNMIVNLNTNLQLEKEAMAYIRVKTTENTWSYPVPVLYNDWFGLKIRTSKIKASELTNSSVFVQNSGIEIPVPVPDVKVDLSKNDVDFSRNTTKFIQVMNENLIWSAPYPIDNKPYFGLIERNKKISGAEYVLPANPDIEYGKGVVANVEDFGNMKKSNFDIPINEPGTRLYFRFKNDRNIWSNSVIAVNYVQGKIINMPGIIKNMSFDGYREGSLYFSTDSIGCFGLDTLFFQFRGSSAVWSADTALIYQCSEKYDIAGETNPCQSVAYKYFTNKKVNSTYLWSVDGGIINGTKNTDTVNVSWTQSGTAILKLTVVTNGKTDSTQFTVNVNPSPNVIITGENWVSPNTTSTYQVLQESGCTYLWDKPVGGKIIGSSTDFSVQVNWVSTGTGKVSITKTNTTTKCVAKSSMSITISTTSAPKVTLTIPDTTASPKEQFDNLFSIPIYLTEKPTSFYPTSVTIKLHLRKTIFLPDDKTFYDNGDYRYITINRSLLNPKLGYPLAYLTGTVLLADMESSPIIFDEITWVGAEVNTTVNNGSLVLTDITYGGNKRLLKNTRPFGIIKISPNPASSIIKLDVIGYEPTKARIRITNLVGEPCYVSDISLIKGLNSYEIDKISSLGSGVYQLSVVSDNSIETKQILIIR
jgi:hypothetical protein